MDLHSDTLPDNAHTEYALCCLFRNLSLLPCKSNSSQKGSPQFKAKPHGDRKQKEWYVNNFNTECLNHYATVKYFYMSEDNIPLQPSVSSIRIFEDM